MRARRPVPVLLALPVLLAACGSGGGAASDVAAGDPEEDAAALDDAEGDVAAPDPGQGAGTDPAPADVVQGETAPPPECNPFLDETGCATDRNCVFDDLGGISCIAKGTVPIGGECGGADLRCERGGCLNMGGTGQRCYEYCSKKLHCPKASDCTFLQGRNWGVCKLTSDVYEDLKCDLLAPACKEGQGCYRTGLADFPICAPAGTAVQGEPCDGGSDCAKGYACNGNACAKLCKPGGEPACDDGFDCDLPYAMGVNLCL
ncbi:MAG: hypothetical protein FJ087_16260 [Deltaproteobacteria bacterium]|nr:hypothetical protein [Deltaproteobacteria bacterium]